jgi:hypothetical protein
MRYLQMVRPGRTVLYLHVTLVCRSYIYAFTSADILTTMLYHRPSLSLPTFLRDEYILRSKQTQRTVMQLRRQWHRKQQSFLGVGHCGCKLVPCVRYRYKCPDRSSLGEPGWVVC